MHSTGANTGSLLNRRNWSTHLRHLNRDTQNQQFLSFCSFPHWQRGSFLSQHIKFSLALGWCWLCWLLLALAHSLVFSSGEVVGQPSWNNSSCADRDTRISISDLCSQRSKFIPLVGYRNTNLYTFSKTLESLLSDKPLYSDRGACLHGSSFRLCTEVKSCPCSFHPILPLLCFNLTIALYSFALPDVKSVHVTGSHSCATLVGVCSAESRTGAVFPSSHAFNS